MISDFERITVPTLQTVPAPDASRIFQIFRGPPSSAVTPARQAGKRWLAGWPRDDAACRHKIRQSEIAPGDVLIPWPEIRLTAGGL
jgi:hypothetical protein